MCIEFRMQSPKRTLVLTPRRAEYNPEESTTSIGSGLGPLVSELCAGAKAVTNKWDDESSDDDESSSQDHDGSSSASFSASTKALPRSPAVPLVRRHVA